MKDKLKHSVIQNLNTYQEYWFWCDSWDGLESLCYHDPNLDSGLPLIKPIKYDVLLTTSNFPLSHYAYVVTLRRLIIRKNGVQLF